MAINPREATQLRIHVAATYSPVFESDVCTPTPPRSQKLVKLQTPVYGILSALITGVTDYATVR